MCRFRHLDLAQLGAVAECYGEWKEQCICSLYPDIMHWEDRATEWSGRPDVASVKLTVARTDTGALVDSAVLGGKSGLATLGGDHPEGLLPKPLADYAATLFRK